MKKVLLIAAHRPDRSPSQRFRFEQYLDYLEQNGFEYTYSFLLSKEDDAAFYSKGNYFRKLLILFKCIWIRLKDLFRANQYDLIFIQREGFFLGITFFEYWFSKSRAKLIFDFDDSIWLQQATERSANKSLFWLKNPNKTGKIISYCDLIFAGNEYLANYARKFNPHVVIIPTTINTQEYTRLDTPKTDSICIGWSGSVTTIDHFNHVEACLITLKEKYKDRIVIKVIGDSKYENTKLDIKGIGWNKQDEIKELSSFDIGIMPLPDDEWANGKCGLKGLQYMALGIPTIMSPVGVNTEIIQHGINGFLASTPDQWIETISTLIENQDLRIKMGEEGRKTVLSKYSVESQKNAYLGYFKSLVS